MARGSFRAWVGLLCGVVAAVACSGRTQSPDSGGSSHSETGGAGGRPEQQPGGSTAASPSGARAGNASGGAIAGQSQGEGGHFETTGGEGGAASPLEPLSFWWTCPREAWGDGRCDCGCGLRDVDCPDGELASCEVCNSPGSCSPTPCPGRIKAEENRHCQPVALGWQCPSLSYGDESSCDCGCGAPDPDCGNASPASCDTCKLPGSCGASRADDCATAIDPISRSHYFVPEEWIFDMPRDGDGVCDCGCGAVDVDCASSSLEECEDCRAGCASSACPGEISPENNALCSPPPAGWLCAEYYYQDYHSCDCGCGIVDPDCATPSSESCDWCNDMGSCSIQTCPGTIAPNDNANCYQPAPPAWWTCSASDYADGATCDCGCGAYDLDCPHQDPTACEDCNTCGACPDSIHPLNNAQCL